MHRTQGSYRVVIEGLENSSALFHALEEAIEEYIDDASSARKAITCALFAWQLAEWVFEEYDTGYKKLADFQAFLRTECRSLAHMQSLITGTKHRTVTLFKPTVKHADSHHGAFSTAFSKDFDVSRLTLGLDGAASVDFDDEVVSAREYWRSYFNNVLGFAV